MTSRQRGEAARSAVRRAELIAIGRTLFADTSYDALSMDDIARQAGVAKGLIYYYFTNKRGYYLAIVEASLAELTQHAAAARDSPPAERLHRTVDAYLRYAQGHQEAYRTIVCGGVGFDAEVHALRAGVREVLMTEIARGAYGRPDIPQPARLALLSWLHGVEGVTLDWLDRPEVPRDTLRLLLARLLRVTLTTIEEFEPGCPAPAAPAEPPF
ncbi:TetR/AcrR family transcriptional regulator [Streptomyces sp. NPDC060194]|uniref:TetR/AcrR family transcriptional regulator n=1 Tax=Streptomyces sp. NPDC060194 TaxID=3347069 RepID=UPI003651B630